MSEASKFFGEFERDILLSVSTLAPGKVLNYDSGTKRADIQPLFLTADSDNMYKQSPIYGVPVLDHCRELPSLEEHKCGDIDCTCDTVLNEYARWRRLKSGDLIFYIPTQRSLADLSGTEYIDPDSHDLMSSNDAVIVGRFSLSGP